MTGSQTKRQNDLWPKGFRSPPMDWRQVGMWRPLVAVLAAFLIPGAIAWGLLVIAGVGGSQGLRQQILWVLYAWAGALPFGWFCLPLTWPLALWMAVRGWAGAASVALAACAIGLPIVHVLLHGDVTTEALGILPNMAFALAVQGLAGWAVLWALIPRAALRSGR